MLKHLKTISLVLCALMVLTLCACNKNEETSVAEYSDYTKYITDEFMKCFVVSDTKTIDTLTNEINSCSEYADKYDTINLICDTVYEYIENENQKYYEMSKYTLDKMSVICTADTAIRDKIQVYYKELIEKMNELTYTYLTGVWERSDSTNFNGGRIKVDFVELEDGEYFIAEIVKTPKINDFAFQKGEIKWKDIIIKNDKTFYFNDLVHAKEGMDYEMAEATINRANDTITVKYTDKFSSSSGSTQIWKKVK